MGSSRALRFIFYPYPSFIEEIVWNYRRKIPFVRERERRMDYVHLFLISVYIYSQTITKIRYISMKDGQMPTPTLEFSDFRKKYWFCQEWTREIGSLILYLIGQFPMFLCSCCTPDIFPLKIRIIHWIFTKSCSLFYFIYCYFILFAPWGLCEHNKPIIQRFSESRRKRNPWGKWNIHLYTQNLNLLIFYCNGWPKSNYYFFNSNTNTYSVFIRKQWHVISN